MNDLLNTELFGLLTKNSQEVSKNEMHNAYATFKQHVKKINQPDNDSSVIFRSLNSTCIEFMALQALLQCEQEKKCAEKSICAKNDMVS